MSPWTFTFFPQGQLCDPRYVRKFRGGWKQQGSRFNPNVENLLELESHGIFAAIPYCLDLIGGPYIETNQEFVKSFRPKKK